MQSSSRIRTVTGNSGVSSQYLLSYGFAKSDQNHDGPSLSGKKKEVNEGVSATSHEKASSLAHEETLLSGDQILSNGVEGKNTSKTPNDKGQINSSNLTPSQFDVLSYNLSELADRISPARTDDDFGFPGDFQNKVYDEDLDPSRGDFTCRNAKPVPTGDRPRSFSDISGKERDLNLRSKLPYSRKSSKKMKNYVPKRKSFGRKQVSALDKKDTFDGSHGYSYEAESECTSQYSLKHDSEDSGYGSSRPSLSQGGNSGKDPEHDASGDSEVLTRKISDVEKRLKSLITGGSLALGDDKAREENFKDAANIPEKSETSVGQRSTEEPTNSELGETYSKTSAVSQVRDPPVGADDSTVDETFKKFDPALEKSPFHPPKGKAAVTSLDDSALPRGRGRPTLVRRRTTLLSFRRPRLMAAQEGEADVVELDEATYTQCVGDIKNMKTMLLKLKRELQEAEVVSPLSRSFTTSASSLSANGANSTRSGLRRSGTYDSAAMHQKLMRIRSASTSSSSAALKQERSPAAERSKEDEVASLREELKVTKEKVEQMSQERRSLLIEREEYEHEIDSKNLTIRLLQKQLEAQDNQDEMAYLKRQVKSLSEQVHHQQNKITELRSRSGPSTPSASGTTPGKRDPAKADIRNRLRDAFVRHLDQSAKNHAQLSKHIQKAEHNISNAQKGLRSLYSSPVNSHSTSREDLNDSALNSQTSRRSRVQMDFFDPKEWLDRARRVLPLAPGSSRKSSGADSTKSESTSSAEQPIRSRDAKRHDEATRRGSVPILGTRPSEHEVEDGSHTDSERFTSRKHSSHDPSNVEKSDRKHSRLLRFGPTTWAPGTIEKIVKSWKETRESSTKPEAQVAPDSKLGPRRGQPHVDFL